MADFVLYASTPVQTYTTAEKGGHIKICIVSVFTWSAGVYVSLWLRR